MIRRVVRRALRLVPVLFALGLLAGCGFHLRRGAEISPLMAPLAVTANDPYSRLAQAVQLAVDDAGAGVKPGATPAATLTITSERWGSLPLSYDQAGRALEYTLRYAVTFRVNASDGRVLLPPVTIEQSRDYVASPQLALGTDSERQILEQEMRRDMAQSVLRRVQAVGAGVAAP
jgi:LPS-assembly lipoprotein